MEAVYRQHQSDLKAGGGSVQLPYALAVKYPNAAKALAWQYVFPAAGFSVDPRSGSVRRHHVDEKRVIVDNSQVTLIKAFKDWGFDPIPCPFLSYGPFGGAFHCATLDIRRRGGLQSYF